MLEAQVGLQPMDRRELAVKLDKTLTLWAAPEGFEVTAEFYLEALEDLPADLVEAALKQVRMTYRYPSMPKPADFRSAVVAELGRRQRQARKLEIAITRARREGEPDRNCGDLPSGRREEVEAAIGGLVAALKAAPEAGEAKPEARANVDHAAIKGALAGMDLPSLPDAFDPAERKEGVGA